MNNWGRCMGLLIPKVSHPNTCHTMLCLKCYIQWELINKPRHKPLTEMWPGQGCLSPAVETTSSIPQECVSQVLFSWQPQFSKGGETSVRTSHRGQVRVTWAVSLCSPLCWHVLILTLACSKLRATQPPHRGREAVTAQSLSEFKKSTDNALGHLVCSWDVLCRDRNWTSWSLWVPFNSPYSYDSTKLWMKLRYKFLLLPYWH